MTLVLEFPLNRACMVQSVILVIDKRFWSSEDFTTTPKPPTVSITCSRGCEHRGSAYPGSFDIWVFL